ncbi:hypothetical protein ACP70R_008500 [Stipagrostis hirtigluma subsp. patula]
MPLAAADKVIATRPFRFFNRKSDLTRIPLQELVDAPADDSAASVLAFHVLSGDSDPATDADADAASHCFSGDNSASPYSTSPALSSGPFAGSSVRWILDEAESTRIVKYVFPMDNAASTTLSVVSSPTIVVAPASASSTEFPFATFTSAAPSTTSSSAAVTSGTNTASASHSGSTTVAAALPTGSSSTESTIPSAAEAIESFYNVAVLETNKALLCVDDLKIAFLKTGNKFSNLSKVNSMTLQEVLKILFVYYCPSNHSNGDGPCLDPIRLSNPSSKGVELYAPVSESKHYDDFYSTATLFVASPSADPKV